MRTSPYVFRQSLKWLTGGLLFIACLLPALSYAANKIVLVSNMKTPSQLAAAEGLVTALSQTFNPEQLSYPLDNGQTLEIELDLNRIPELTHNPDVLTLVCINSVACRLAADDAANKELLVISLTATSSQLTIADNMLRMAPSNISQANAIYKRLKEGVKTGRFAVVYEPDAYGADLYENFIFNYLNEKILEQETPHWVMGIALHDHLLLDASQKTVNAAKVLQTLATQSLDAVVYMGMDAGFLDLTDAARGGNAQVAARWYAGDGVEEIPTEKGFNGLEIIRLAGSGREGPGGIPRSASYFYAQDAGLFIAEVKKQYISQNATTRAQWLDIAKTVQILGRTGDKGFNVADPSQFFDVLIFKENGQTDSATISGASDY
ncbi:ABC transporter substrate-binding protein [Thioflexithrix psekupsensis]|uniref:Leucine-binding protein domain-containing protein n=1 Tax=Thioflexithrix psekupsensis TaxID=1570016 RepID=A0A251XB20_9GAMM|nr:ABC transporter substrate-binding protein [Thioflexithrix psekupsensis]OUD15632.1 hypothetical protein TPSD3_03685 [Thioflexithrix psekupsensis]